MELAGRVAIVTGASSGIGRATALALAHEGVDVVAVARRASLLAELVEECRPHAPNSFALAGDVGDRAFVQGIVAQTLERAGRLDILVNNAAVPLHKPIYQISVEDASGGRVGYVHVRGMNDASFRRVYRETLGLNADKEALIVDTRFNGGGWLHDDLVVFLSGQRYLDFQPRGKVRGSLGGEPLQRWDKPSCVVMSEGNYSDAHMFPWAYREHGIGKLVGAPVAGTGTAVWWETLIDRELIFGIPQVGMVDRRGEYLENQTLEPDVTVLTEPSRVAAGMDDQLLEAVRVLLAELNK